MASGVQPSWTAVSVLNFVPITAGGIALFLHGGQTSGAYSAVAPNNTYPVGNATGVPALYVEPSNAVSCSAHYPFEFRLESSNIYFCSNAANSYLYCFGWEDNL